MSQDEDPIERFAARLAGDTDYFAGWFAQAGLTVTEVADCLGCRREQALSLSLCRAIDATREDVRCAADLLGIDPDRLVALWEWLGGR